MTPPKKTEKRPKVEKKSLKQMKEESRKKAAEKIQLLVNEAVIKNQMKCKDEHMKWLEKHNEEYIHLRRSTVYKVAMVPVCATGVLIGLGTFISTLCTTAPALFAVTGQIGGIAMFIGSLAFAAYTYVTGGLFKK